MITLKKFDNEIRLCGKGKCCPAVSFDGDFIKVTDDYNGAIKLTLEEALHLSKAVKELDSLPKEENLKLSWT